MSALRAAGPNPRQYRTAWPQSFSPWDELLQARQLSCNRTGVNTPLGKSLGKWNTKSSLFTSTESRQHDEKRCGRLGNVLNLVSRDHNADKVSK